MNIFLTKNLDSVKKAKSYNIILSPEFYFVREFEIPTNSIHKAKKLVSGIYEEFIDVSDKNYYLKKIDNFKYIAIAYNEQEIKQKLKILKIETKVKNIYFSQFELDFESCIAINGYNLIKIDKIVLVNKIDTDKCKDFDISNIKFSNNKLILNEFSFFSNTQLNILIFIILVISSINFTKYFEIENRLDNIPQEIEKLKKEYNLFPSKIQTKAIIDELKLKKQDYLKFRDMLYKILKLKSFTNLKIDYIEFKNKQFEVSLNSSNMAQVIKEVNKLNPTKKNINNNKLIFWVKL